MKLPPDKHLYIDSDAGPRVRVTAIFHDTDAANAHMEQHEDDAVITVIGPYVFLASVRDQGKPR
jgi:hypothetical protein